MSLNYYAIKIVLVQERVLQNTTRKEETICPIMSYCYRLSEGSNDVLLSATSLYLGLIFENDVQCMDDTRAVKGSGRKCEQANPDSAHGSTRRTRRTYNQELLGGC